MKSISKIVVLTAILILAACSNGENQKSISSIDFKTFVVNQPAPAHFSEFGKITRVAKLETTENSVFGNIDRIRIDKKSGDILIGDFDSSKKVHRFSKDGNYINSYGNIGPGPGQHQKLRGFCIDENGDILLIADYKLLKYAQSGVFLLEKGLDFCPKEIEVIKDKIFISMTGYIKNLKNRKAIQIFNSFLVNTGGVGQYEPRFDKYVFIGSKTCAASKTRLYFTENYDFGVNVFDLNTQKISRLRIPSNNSTLDSIWEKKELLESDMTEIKNRLQFFSTIYNYNDNLFLFEDCIEKNSINVWRINIEKKVATIFSLYCFLKNEVVKNHDQLFISSIAGADDNGLIVTFQDPVDFNRYKAGNPILKNIEFNLDDNPIIAFFEFNDESMQ